MKPKAKLMSDNKKVLFRVESDFPGSSDTFKHYINSAYVHVDSPQKCMFNTHPEFFEDLQRSETLSFNSYESAKKLADFIAEFGRLRVGWDGPEMWRKNYRGKIKTRVVMISTRETTHLME